VDGVKAGSIIVKNSSVQMRDGAMIAVVMTVDVAQKFCLVRIMDIFGVWPADLNFLKLPFLAVVDEGDCGCEKPINGSCAWWVS
jgi:hypothetical protein